MMSVAKILTMLDGDSHDAVDLEACRLLTGKFGCHVDLLHVRNQHDYPRTYYGEGVSDEIYKQLQTSFKSREETITDNCRSLFDEWCRSNDISAAARPSGEEGPTARFLDESGDLKRTVARYGRLADLVVLKSPSLEDGWLSPAGGAAIYSTGRPVLFSPKQKLFSLGDKISMFWNDTVESTRAATVAMPFMQRAASVEIVTIDQEHLDQNKIEDFAEYLGWHGVDATFRLVPLKHRTTGEALIDAAWEYEADLIVMGAYGHSRLREMMLGGVTRHILKVAGRPVMMMH